VAATMRPTRRRFTVDEYHKMVDCGILHEDDRVELIEGEIVQMSPIGSRHAAQVRRLNRVLGRLVADRAIVAVQDPVALSPDSEPEPDVTLLAPRPDFYRARHPGPEDVLLLIEVSDSSADHDREIKLPLYARAGIREVWIVDLAAPDAVDVHQVPSATGFTRALRHARGETLAIPGLPDTVVAVDAILG